MYNAHVSGESITCIVLVVLGPPPYEEVWLNLDYKRGRRICRLNFEVRSLVAKDFTLLLDEQVGYTTDYNNELSSLASPSSQFFGVGQ